MDLPPLTFGICTYKRPWYACMTIQMLIGLVGYAGPKRFHIADGGSSEEELRYYKELTKEFPTTVEVTDNLSDMVNSCARNGGDLWMVILDDFMPIHAIDITPDAVMLLKHPEIGCVRMGRLAFWGNGENENGEFNIYADLIGSGGLHWWRMDKDKSEKAYMCTIGFNMYHRRFWDAYGDIKPCDPKVPGQAELFGNERYYQHSGPTIATPMRFGEDSLEQKEPIWHMGIWKTDEYSSSAGTRW